MFTSGSIVFEIVLRTAIIYIAVLVGMRLAGKRQVGQMTPFDLVVLLLIANAVQNAMTGPDTSLVGGLVAAATLLVLNAIISRLALRNRRARHVVEGEPTLLVHAGRIIRGNLAQEKIGEEEILQALREHGVATIEEVQGAVLEIDGSISVIKKDEMPKMHQVHHRIRFLRRNAG